MSGATRAKPQNMDDVAVSVPHLVITDAEFMRKYPIKWTPPYPVPIWGRRNEDRLRGYPNRRQFNCVAVHAVVDQGTVIYTCYEPSAVITGVGGLTFVIFVKHLF